MESKRPLTRRRVIQLLGSDLIGSWLLSACGSGASTVTPTRATSSSAASPTAAQIIPTS